LAESIADNAGELQGLTRGTILAVHPPLAERSESAAPLGYVRIEELSPFSALVVPCDWKDAAAVQADALPDEATCGVVSREFGDMRLRVGIGAVDPVQQRRMHHLLMAAIKDASPQLRELVEFTDDLSAEWQLAPDPGRESGSMSLVLLGPGPDVGQRVGGVERAALRNDSRSPEDVAFDGRSMYGGYQADSQYFIRDLEQDLPKIFRWRNLWRIAGTLDEGAAVAEELDLKVVRLSAVDRPLGTLASGSAVSPGQRLEIRLSNEGLVPLWVTVLLLESDFGITELTSTALRAGDAIKPIRGTIGKSSLGAEGLIVLAVPISNVAGPMPRFNFLAQPNLGTRTRSAPAAPDWKPSTPFERLLSAAALGTGSRSFQTDQTDQPRLRSWSWNTVAFSPDGTTPMASGQRVPPE
jgi:hypothetical protein